MPLVQVQQGEPLKRATIRWLFLMAFFYCTCTINTVSSSHASPTEPSEVGGKACFAPLLHQKICKKFFDVIVAVLQAKLLPVAEEASRVWRSGRFFAPQVEASLLLCFLKLKKCHKNLINTLYQFLPISCYISLSHKILKS